MEVKYNIFGEGEVVCTVCKGDMFVDDKLCPLCKGTRITHLDFDNDGNDITPSVHLDDGPVINVSKGIVYYNNEEEK